MKIVDLYAYLIAIHNTVQIYMNTVNIKAECFSLSLDASIFLAMMYDLLKSKKTIKAINRNSNILFLLCSTLG